MNRGRGSQRPAGAREALLRVAVAGASGDAVRLRRAVRTSRATGLTRRALEETALMLVLYAGFPAALETLRSLSSAWPGRARRTREGGPTVWRRRGVALCRRVYGPVYGRLLARVRDLHPDLAAWMLETGYGRVLSRHGLEARTREVITVALLAAIGRERQLVSHLLGAARLGATQAELCRAVRIGAGPAAARVAARRAWRAAFGTALTFTGSPP